MITEQYAVTIFLLCYCPSEYHTFEIRAIDVHIFGHVSQRLLYLLVTKIHLHILTKKLQYPYRIHIALLCALKPRESWNCQPLRFQRIPLDETPHLEKKQTRSRRRK